MNGNDDPTRSDPNNSNQGDIPTLSRIDDVKAIGTKIGRYKILSVLGEGGFGIVYLAEQKHPIRRQVALKIIKPGMDSKQVILRFKAERQALALLDHPNIARIHDAGTTDNGLPYFVMEYVKGEPITEYCDGNRLNTEQRLHLFLQVCEGIQHAHQKGLIHRDVKPSNILVTRQGEKAVPKVIDFGVAKAVNQPLTEHTLFTAQGQFIGTPEYMSPEQAELTNQDIDTRSDVFSLGVVLYELISGTLPFDSETLRGAAFDEILRIIRHEEPPRPSTKLSGLGDEAKAIAERHCTQLKTLTTQLHNELEWIPLKAIRKESSRRYQSASELADDISNYLAGNSLLAGPESAGYRLKKAIKRNRVLVTGIAAVLVVLIAGIIVSMGFAFGATKARKSEENQRIAEEQARTKAESSEKIALEQRKKVERLLAKSQLDRGVRLLNEGNCLGLLDLLDARITATEIPDLRDSAARLWAIAHDLQSERLVNLMPNSNTIAYSPDGRLLATSIGDRAQLWDTGTGLPHGPSLQLGTYIHAIAVSPSGKLAVTHSHLGVSKLWNTATGRQIGPTLRHGGAAVRTGSDSASWSAAFSPDSRLLATASADGTVHLWNTETGRVHGPTMQHYRGVWTVAFSPDGKLLASGSEDMTVRVWEVATGHLHCEPLEHDSRVSKVVFSPNGKLLATSTARPTIRLWKTDTWELHQMPFEGIRRLHNVDIDMAFSPDGNLLGTTSLGSTTSTAQLWDTTTGQLHCEHLSHKGRVLAVAFSPDGKLVATGSADQTVQLWDVSTAEPYGPPLYCQAQIRSIAFSPDGKFLATCVAEGGATNIWRTSWFVQTHIAGDQHAVWAGLKSPNGQIGVVTSGDEKTVWLYDTTTSKKLFKRLDHDEAVVKTVFSPCAKYLACQLSDGTVFFWDFSTGNKMGEQFLKLDDIWTLGPGGRFIGHSGLGVEHEAWVSDWTTGLALHSFPCDEEALAMAFSSNGTVLALASRAGEVKLWDLATGKQCSSPIQCSSPVKSVAFDSEGDLLATVSTKNGIETVRLWDVALGPPYASLPLPPQILGDHSVLGSFTNNGTIIIEKSPDGTGSLWHLPKKPADLEEMRQQTLVTLGVDRNANGQIEPIFWKHWRDMREELVRMDKEGESKNYCQVPLQFDSAEHKRLQDQLEIALEDEMFDIRHKVLSLEEMLASMNSIASSYGRQDRYKDAERVYLKAMAMSQVVMSDDYEQALRTRNDLAYLYVKQGRFEDAERVFLEALELGRNALDQGHNKFQSQVLETVNCVRFLLAPSHKEQERLEDAERIYLRMLDLLGSHLKEEQAGILSHLRLLAWDYGEHDHNEDAERVYLKALEISQDVLGDEHEQTLISLETLAKWYDTQDRYKDAEPLYLKALEINRDVLGDEHEQTLVSLETLAKWYDAQDRYKDAEPLYLKAIKISRRLRSEGYPATLAMMSRLTRIYIQQDLNDEVNQLCTDVLLELDIATRRASGAEKLESDSLDASNELQSWQDMSYQLQHLLAKDLVKSGFYEQALELLDRLHAHNVKVLGGDNHYTQWCLQSLAWFQATCPEPEFRNATEAIQNATELCELNSWKETFALRLLAAAYAEAGDFATAAKWQKMAIELLSESYRMEFKAKLTEQLSRYEAGKPYLRSD